MQALSPNEETSKTISNGFEVRRNQYDDNLISIEEDKLRASIEKKILNWSNGDLKRRRVGIN